MQLSRHFLVTVSCLTLTLAGCEDRIGHPNHTLIVELRYLAQSATEVLDKEIKADQNWQGQTDLVIQAIQADDYWSEINDGEITTSGGKDPWGKMIQIYRMDDAVGIYVVAESGGPDGDLTTTEDNVSAQYLLDSLPTE